MKRLGGQGYPTLGIEREGRLERIELNQYLGEPELLIPILVKR